MHERTSIALTRSMAHHPEVQHDVADMRMALEPLDAHPRPDVRRLGGGVDHGVDWPLKIVGTASTPS